MIKELLRATARSAPSLPTNSLGGRLLLSFLSTNSLGGEIMSESFFDRLAKSMSGGSSRRQALKAMGGALAGSLLLGLTGTAKADQREDERRCRGCFARDCRDGQREACLDS